jgi:hypothetical protein
LDITASNVSWTQIQGPDNGLTSMVSIDISGDVMCGLTAIIRHQGKCAPFMTSDWYWPGNWIFDILLSISSNNRYCGVDTGTKLWYGQNRSPLQYQSSYSVISNTIFSSCEISGNQMCFISNQTLYCGNHRFNSFAAVKLPQIFDALSIQPGSKRGIGLYNGTAYRFENLDNLALANTGTSTLSVFSPIGYFHKVAASDGIVFIRSKHRHYGCYKWTSRFVVFILL